MNIVVENLNEITIANFLSWAYNLQKRFSNIKKVNLTIVNESDCLMTYGIFYFNFKHPNIAHIIELELHSFDDKFIAGNETSFNFIVGDYELLLFYKETSNGESLVSSFSTTRT